MEKGTTEDGGWSNVVDEFREFCWIATIFGCDIIAVPHVLEER